MNTQNLKIFKIFLDFDNKSFASESLLQLWMRTRRSGGGLEATTNHHRRNLPRRCRRQESRPRRARTARRRQSRPVRRRRSRHRHRHSRRRRRRRRRWGHGRKGEGAQSTRAHLARSPRSPPRRPSAKATFCGPVLCHFWDDIGVFFDIPGLVLA